MPLRSSAVHTQTEDWDFDDVAHSQFTGFRWAKTCPTEKQDDLSETDAAALSDECSHLNQLTL